MARQVSSQVVLTQEYPDEVKSAVQRWDAVQRVVFGLEGKPEKLYFRWRPSIRNDILAQSPPKSHRLSLDAERGVLLNFCTLCNAFFESHWLQYTAIQGIAFRITVENGKGWIKLVRMMPSKERVQIALQFFDARDAPVTLTLPADRTDPKSAGILFIELMATEGPLRLCRGAWLALCDRPVTLPRLYIGICTYNRERFVKLLLRTLAADEFVAELIDGILLVSQGEDTQDIIDGMGDLPPDFAQKVKVVQQANMGGSGGFGRVMYEMSTAEDGVCVLMDDDIEIEPESLFRAAGFHALLREPACIGGQMLQLERPSVIWETGAKAHHGRLSVSVPLTEIDASRIKGIRQLVQPTECAFNAWWFFLFSTSLIRQHGFPLPLFIKGDDLEYGLRLLQNNTPTITLPGVFVWHESFSFKFGGPVLYYELRNSLIIAAIYHNRFSIKEAARELWWRWSDRALVHDYGRAHLLLKAVTDFLKGPGALQTANPAKLHLEVIAAYHRYSTAGVSSARTVISGGSPRGVEERQREFKGWRVLRILRALSARVAPQPTTMPIVNAQTWHWRAISTHSYYAVDLADSTKLITFARSRKNLVLAILSFLWSSSQLMVFGRRAQREWKSALPELTGEQFWERYLRGAGMHDASRLS